MDSTGPSLGGCFPLRLALTRECLLLTLLTEASLGFLLLMDSTGPSLGGCFPLPLSEELTGTGLIGTLLALSATLLGLHLSSLLLVPTLTSHSTLGFLLTGHSLRLTLSTLDSLRLALSTTRPGNSLSLLLGRLLGTLLSLGSLLGHLLRGLSLPAASGQSLRLGELLSSLLLELLPLGRKLTDTGLIGTLLALVALLLPPERSSLLLGRLLTTDSKLGGGLAGLLLHGTLLRELRTALSCDSLRLRELSSTLSSLLRLLGGTATSLTGLLHAVLLSELDGLELVGTLLALGLLLLTLESLGESLGSALTTEGSTTGQDTETLLHVLLTAGTAGLAA